MLNYLDQRKPEPTEADLTPTNDFFYINLTNHLCVLRGALELSCLCQCSESVTDIHEEEADPLRNVYFLKLLLLERGLRYRQHIRASCLWSGFCSSCTKTPPPDGDGDNDEVLQAQTPEVCHSLFFWSPYMSYTLCVYGIHAFIGM